MSKKIYIVGVLLVCFFANTYGQLSSKGIGAGITFQAGINTSDFLQWESENTTKFLSPEPRVYLGSLIQYKNFSKVQFETGLIFSREYFVENNSFDIIKSVNLKFNEWQMPLSVNINQDAPIKYHSNIVYTFGIVASQTVIPVQQGIQKKYQFINSALQVGLRLATEMKSYGRFEYGLSYISHLQKSRIFQMSYDDIAPTTYIHNLGKGQLRANVIYYFTPRLFNWSKSRYQMKSIQGYDE